MYTVPIKKRKKKKAKDILCKTTGTIDTLRKDLKTKVEEEFKHY